MSTDPYQQQYETYQGYEQQLNEAYNTSLSNMGSQNCYAALITFMASTANIILMSYGLQQMMAANTMDALAQMQSDANIIRSNYDSFAQNGSTSAIDWQSIIDAANDMSEIANNFSGITQSSNGKLTDDINTQLATIMGSSNPSEWTTSSISNYWLESFIAANPDIVGVSGDTTYATDSAQPITNAFTALTTDFSNLSSTSQSSMQYYSSNAQQMEGLDNNLMQSYATEEQTMINNQIAN